VIWLASYRYTPAQATLSRNAPTRKFRCTCSSRVARYRNTAAPAAVRAVMTPSPSVPLTVMNSTRFT
jgi:hypothetical protein